MSEKFIRALKFVDSLCHLGEEPGEIEFYVYELAEHAFPLVVSRFESCGIAMPNDQMIEDSLKDLYGFVYLQSEKRARTIRKLSVEKIKKYLTWIVTESKTDAIPVIHAVATVTGCMIDVLEELKLVQGAENKRKAIYSFMSGYERETKYEKLAATLH
jgi:DNA primase large subunit